MSNNGQLARVIELLERIAAGVERLNASAEAERVAAASPLLKAEQVADLLQIDGRTLRRFEVAGDVPRAITIGGVKRWRRAEIDRWLAKLRAA
jgi:predicted DNA-binding transcriptional regulator AlpA